MVEKINIGTWNLFYKNKCIESASLYYNNGQYSKGLYLQTSIKKIFPYSYSIITNKVFSTIDSIMTDSITFSENFFIPCDPIMLLEIYEKLKENSDKEITINLEKTNIITKFKSKIVLRDINEIMDEILLSNL